MAQGFSRVLRLTTRADFVRVQGKGRRQGGRHATLFALQNELGHHRLGVVASRRVGGAVIRNRAKRRIREIFRTMHDEMRVGRGLDIVVVAKPEFAAAAFGAVRAELGHALLKLR